MTFSLIQHFYNDFMKSVLKISMRLEKKKLGEERSFRLWRGGIENL